MSVSDTPGKYTQLKEALHLNRKALLSSVSLLIYAWCILTLALVIYFGIVALTSTRLNLQVIYGHDGLQVTGFDLSALKELQDSQQIQPGDFIIAFDNKPTDQFLAELEGSSQAIFYAGGENSAATLLTPGGTVRPTFKENSKENQNLLLWSVRVDSLTLDVSHRPAWKGPLVQQLRLSELSSRLGQQLLVEVLLFIAIVFWLVSLLLYLLRPLQPITIIFSFLCNLIALEVVVSTSELYQFGPLEKVVLVCCSGFMGILFFHFTLLFPNGDPVSRPPLRRGLVLLYSLSLVLAVLRLYVSFGGFTQTAPLTSEPLIRNLCYVLFLALIFAGVIVLLVKLFTAPKQDRPRLRLAVTAIAVAVLIPLVPLSAYVLFGVWERLVADRFGIFFVPLLFLPPLFAYAVVKNKLLGIDLTVRRFLVAVVVNSGVILGYFILSGLITAIFPFWQNFDREPVVIVLFLVLLSLILGQLSRRVQKFIDRLFGVDPLDYAELSQYWNSELVKTNRLSVICSKVIEKLGASFHYKTSWLLISQPQLLQLIKAEGSVEPAKKLEWENAPMLLVSASQSAELNCGSHQLIKVSGSDWGDEAEQAGGWLAGYTLSTLDLAIFTFLPQSYMLVDNEANPNEAKQIFAGISFLKAHVALPLKVGENFYGLWLLGDKTGEYQPAREELKHLSTLATQVATSFYNSILLTQAVALAQTELKLRQAGELVQNHREQAADLEREKLAEALHNDILQDLVIAVQDVEELPSSLAGISPGMASQQEIAARLRQTIEKLRNITREVMPLQLEKSLLYGLYHTIQNYRIQHPDLNFIAEFLEGDERQEALLESLLNKDLKLCLYRVVQESILNSIKHSGGTTIKILIELTETLGASSQAHAKESTGGAGTGVKSPAYVLEIQIIDDGVGLEPQFLDTIPSLVNQNHFGLSNMQKRIESAGGEISFYSKPGQGMQVAISLILTGDSPAGRFDLDKFLQELDFSGNSIFPTPNN